MINIRTCFSRNSVFRKLQLFDSHASIYCSMLSNPHRPYHERINKKIEDRFRSEDSIGREYRIIYRAPYINYLRLTYAITGISSAIVVPLVGSALMMAGVGNYPVMLGDLTLINSDLEFCAFIGVVMLVVGQINYVVLKYPFRIYHNASNGKYIAIYQHLFPWKKHKEEFYAGEVKKVVKSYSLWRECLFQVKEKRAILLEDYFFLPQDFNDMLSTNDKKDK